MVDWNLMRIFAAERNPQVSNGVPYLRNSIASK